MTKRSGKIRYLALALAAVLAGAAFLVLERKTIFGGAEDASLPAKFDWRDVNGQDYTTPAVYQGRSGACGPFAEIGVLESLDKIRLRDPRAKSDLSEQFLLSCMADYDGGLNPPETQRLNEAWKTTGIVDEACFPYVPTDEVKKIPCAPCDDWRSRVAAKVTARIPIDPDPKSMKRAIVAEGPIVVGMDLYEDQVNYRGGVYRRGKGALLGGHVVMVVGYDDREGFWIVKNTAPAGWGENGFMRIAYGESGFGRNPYALEAEFLR